MRLAILLVVLLLLAVGPAWPHSPSWGYYPSSGLGLLVVTLFVIFLFSPQRVWW
jgi:hypothetical protein